MSQNSHSIWINQDPDSLFVSLTLGDGLVKMHGALEKSPTHELFFFFLTSIHTDSYIISFRLMLLLFSIREGKKSHKRFFSLSKKKGSKTLFQMPSRLMISFVLLGSAFRVICSVWPWLDLWGTTRPPQSQSIPHSNRFRLPLSLHSNISLSICLTLRITRVSEDLSILKLILSLCSLSCSFPPLKTALSLMHAFLYLQSFLFQSNVSFKYKKRNQTCVEKRKSCIMPPVSGPFYGESLVPSANVWFASPAESLVIRWDHVTRSGQRVASRREHMSLLSQNT